MVFYLSLHLFSGGIEERKTFNELGSQHVSMSKVQLSQRVDEWVGCSSYLLGFKKAGLIPLSVYSGSFRGTF